MNPRRHLPLPDCALSLSGATPPHTEPKLKDPYNQGDPKPRATQTCLGLTEVYSTLHPPCTKTEPPRIIQTIWDGDKKPSIIKILSSGSMLSDAYS